MFVKPELLILFLMLCGWIPSSGVDRSDIIVTMAAISWADRPSVVCISDMVAAVWSASAFLAWAFSLLVTSDLSVSKSLIEWRRYVTMCLCLISKGNGSGRGSAQIKTTGLPFAIAKPTSYQMFGLLAVISARHISVSRMPFSMSSIRTVVAGSSSTRYGVRPAASVAGFNTSR